MNIKQNKTQKDHILIIPPPSYKGGRGVDGTPSRTSRDIIRAAILDFNIFLESHKITEIDTKSSQNAYGM